MPRGRGGSGRGRGRGRGRGAAAVVPYSTAGAGRGGAGDSGPAPRVSYGGNCILHEYPQTPTPLPVRVQRQKRRSEAGFRPRIVELDPETDRTIQPTPAPSTAARRSSVQSRISVTSSVPSFSPGGVVTSTRIESPGRRSSVAGKFVRPRTPPRRASDRTAGGGSSQPPAQDSNSGAAGTVSGAAQTVSGAAPADSWQTPLTRRSATSFASSSAPSTPDAPSAQTTKISAKRSQDRSRSSAGGSGNRTKPSKSLEDDNNNKSDPRRGQSLSANSSAAKKPSPRAKTSVTKSQSRSAASSAARSQSRGGRGRAERAPAEPSGRARDRSARSAGQGRGRSARSAGRGRGRSARSAGRGRGARSAGRGRGAVSRSRSPIHQPEVSDGERVEDSDHSEAEGTEGEVSGGESGSDREEADFDDSHDRTFRPSAEDRLSSSVRRGRPPDPAVYSARRRQTTRPGEGRRSGLERSNRGQTSPSATATGRGTSKSAGKAGNDTTSRSRSDHPALDDSRGRGRARNRGRSSVAPLRCPLTVRVAGRTRKIAADSRADLLETVEDLMAAARARPLQGWPEIGRFSWDLDQCVIDLIALKDAGRHGATKMLTAVRRNRNAAEALLNPHKVELVELYNEAFKADAERRRDEFVDAFLFDDDSDE